MSDEQPNNHDLISDCARCSGMPTGHALAGEHQSLPEHRERSYQWEA
jgi:hypothetical protein